LARPPHGRLPATLTELCNRAGYTGLGGLAGLVCAVFGFVSMLGLVTANAMAGALAAFPHRAGTAPARADAVQFGMGAVSSAAVG
jgi:DHA1 family bicyclomycin/chloramphenicol resistance-like MFS transporter